MNPTDRITTLQRQIEVAREEQVRLAREAPPISFERDLCRDRCNITDPVFEAYVRAFMAREMSSINTTLLDREDYEKWENLTPRFEVREVEVPLSDDPDADEVTMWRVWDHDEDGYVEDEDGKPLTFARDFDAHDTRGDLEQEDEQNGYGFPFAWNTGWVMEGEYWTAQLREAGFKVYRYDGDTIIAGIDGGGYSFMGAHFAPFYARLAEKNGWLVETVDGPRRLVFESPDLFPPTDSPDTDTPDTDTPDTTNEQE